MHMRKIFMAALALIVLAGCNHSDGFGMEFDANPDVIRDVGLFQKLEVDMGTSLSPRRVVRKVSVDSDRFINVTMRFYEDFDTEPAYECTGMELLDEQTFEVILAYVYDADLINYVEGDLYMVGGTPAEIRCEFSDGRLNEFGFARMVSDDKTDQEQIIDEMLQYLGDLAEGEIDDCNASTYKFDEDESGQASDDEAEGEDDSDQAGETPDDDAEHGDDAGAADGSEDAEME